MYLFIYDVKGRKSVIFHNAGIAIVSRRPPNAVSVDSGHNSNLDLGRHN